MALSVEKGVFTAATGGGDQDVTLVDSALTPQAVILWGTFSTAEGIENNDWTFSMGMGTRRGGATQQGYVCFFSDDARTAISCVRDLNTDAVYKMLTSDAIDATATDAEATLVSFGAGTFRINWSNAPSIAFKVHYKVLGGSDITDAMVSQNDLTTAVATQDVSIAGDFGRPDLVLLAHHSSDDNFVQADAAFGFGAFKSDTERATLTVKLDDNATTVVMASVFASDAAGFFFTDTGAVTVDGIMDISPIASWPANGFQLAYDDQVTLAYKVLFLCLKGTFTSTIGTAEMLTAGSTQDLALASGTPKGALLVGGETALTSRTIDTTAADLGGFWVGGMDGTREGLAGGVDDDANTDTRTSRFHSESKTVARHIADAAGGAATLDAEADGTISGSNIRLTYNDLAAVAADFVYVLFGEAAAGAAPAPFVLNQARDYLG